MERAVILFIYFYLFYQLCPEEYTNNNLNIWAGTPQQLEPITADPKNKR